MICRQVSLIVEQSSIYVFGFVTKELLFFALPELSKVSASLWMQDTWENGIMGEFLGVEGSVLHDYKEFRGVWARTLRLQ